MKLRTKLISSFSCVIILLLLIGLASQYFNDKIKNKVIDESRGAVQELEISGKMESYLYQSFVDVQYYLDEPYRSQLNKNLQDSLQSVESVRQNVKIAMQGLNLHLEKIERVIKNENNATSISAKRTKNNLASLAKLKRGVMFYNALIDQLLSYDQDNFEEAKGVLTTTVEPHFRNKMLPLLDTFRSQIRTNLDDQVVVLNHRLNRYSNILLGATLIAFLISLVLAYLLYKSITTPLHSLSQAAREIGHGNLNKRITIQSDDEIGALGRSFNRMAENLNKITFSKEYVDDIIESMRDGLIVTDPSFEITKINSAAAKMLDYSTEELIGKPLAQVMTADHGEVLLSNKEGRVIENYETRFKRRDGRTFPVNLSRSVIHGNESGRQSVVYVAGDITERKRSERKIKASLKEKETLLAEIHHRVKNNLAVISGLLQMQRWETDSEAAENVLQDSQLRVKSIALVHEKLYQSDNLSSIKFDQYVDELVAGINKTFKNSDTEIVFNLDIAPLSLSVSQAIPCSLLLNELIVNIHKHAFKHQKKGKVTIKLWDEEGAAHLIVEDNGQGLDEPTGKSDGHSLGMSLLETLVKQLDGELFIAGENGASFEIIFELDE